MRAFRFRLESILTLRRQKEDIARLSYAEAVRARVQVEEERSMLVDQMHQLEGSIAETRGKRFLASIQAGYHQSLEYARDRIKDCDRKLERIQAHEKKAFDAYTRAKQSRELLDRSRERSWNQYKAEQIRAEEIEVEELANARYCRNRLGGQLV
ncbi:MAG: hypothetical protein Tsb0018_11220 [Opitutales bacterium]|tara:strand:- start:91 stop:552 length:462 start_codon:yes stop_codon:yes gene_type:complete